MPELRARLVFERGRCLCSPELRAARNAALVGAALCRYRRLLCVLIVVGCEGPMGNLHGSTCPAPSVFARSFGRRTGRLLDRPSSTTARSRRSVGRSVEGCCATPMRLREKTAIIRARSRRPSAGLRNTLARSQFAPFLSAPRLSHAPTPMREKRTASVRSLDGTAPIDRRPKGTAMFFVATRFLTVRLY